MRLVESSPQVWRQTKNGGTRELSGETKTIKFENPGEKELGWLRGRLYLIENNIWKLAPDDLVQKVLNLELKKV